MHVQSTNRFWHCRCVKLRAGEAAGLVHWCSPQLYVDNHPKLLALLKYLVWTKPLPIPRVNHSTVSFSPRFFLQIWNWYLGRVCFFFLLVYASCGKDTRFVEAWHRILRGARAEQRSGRGRGWGWSCWRDTTVSYRLYIYIIYILYIVYYI